MFYLKMNATFYEIFSTDVQGANWKVVEVVQVIFCDISGQREIN